MIVPLTTAFPNFTFRIIKKVYLQLLGILTDITVWPGLTRTTNYFHKVFCNDFSNSEYCNPTPTVLQAPLDGNQTDRQMKTMAKLLAGRAKRRNTDVEEKLWSGRNTSKEDSAVVGWSFDGGNLKEYEIQVLLCYVSAEWLSVWSINITILIIHYRTTKAHKWFIVIAFLTLCVQMCTQNFLGL